MKELEQKGITRRNLIAGASLSGTALALSLFGCGGGNQNLAAGRATDEIPPLVYGVAPDINLDEPTTVEASHTRMIGGDRRLAVRNEAWYALNSDWLTKPNDENGPGSNGTASSWHYLSAAADANSGAIRYALQTYGSYTHWNIPDTPNGALRQLSASEIEKWVSVLNQDPYTMQYGAVKGVGHGCQCVSFVSMILYRALGGYRLSWSWSNINSRQVGSASSAQSGDLIFRTSGIQHIAICARNKGGQVTLVDSNYVGGAPNEVIARHDVPTSTIDNTWKKYSGSGLWY